MDRWEIRATPSPDDPARHLLLLHAAPADIASLLRRFGALLGRPRPHQAEGFNLGMTVHKLTDASRARLEAWLQKNCDKETAPATSRTTTAPKAAPPKTAKTTTAAAARPSVAPERAKETAPPAAAPKENFDMILPLRPEWTLDSLIVGAHNRFAHAAAMSVVGTPGTMYNPLFFHGAPGCGKSHLLHAIGTALSKGLGDAVLLTTTGARLSWAVDGALAESKLDALLARIKELRALLVDDIHLLAVNDQNKDALASVFKAFMERQKQIVITSPYPPRALGALEVALKISFSRGWSVDLKLPGTGGQREILNATLERLGAGFSVDETTLLHEKLAQAGYQEMSLWIMRLLELRRRRSEAGQNADMSALLELTYEPTIFSAGDLPESTEAVSPSGGSFKMVRFAPQSSDDIGAYAEAMLAHVGAQHGFISHGSASVASTYDAGQAIGVPFQIADACRRAGARGALVVGPPLESTLGPRSVELAHAIRHLLASAGIALAWIPYGGLRTSAHYLNGVLDLSAAGK